ncbi:MAG: single-stranded DNA-binding protein [Planctomycetaceae bacterium]|nr:MAG: single-stranded DNA-binding protein [Planctomycetaceae bacterium]
MASFNKVILMGNLTRDPVLKYTPAGTAVTEIGLAINRSWQDRQSNQRREETTFIDVTLWGRQAEIAGEYLKKGRTVLIEGRLQTDSWEDKETKQKRSRVRVVAENMTMIDNRRDYVPREAGGYDASVGSRGDESFSDALPVEQEQPDDEVPF